MWWKMWREKIQMWMWNGRRDWTQSCYKNLCSNDKNYTFACFFWISNSRVSINSTLEDDYAASNHFSMAISQRISLPEMQIAANHTMCSKIDSWPFGCEVMNSDTKRWLRCLSNWVVSNWEHAHNFKTYIFSILAQRFYGMHLSERIFTWEWQPYSY